MSTEPQIILAVPGRWANRTDLVGKVAEASGGYLLAGNVLAQVGAERAWQVEVQGANPHLARAFEAGGRGSFSVADLDAVARHTRVVYLLGPGGSEDAARASLGAAAGLLRAGGVAVNVESTGKSHPRETWFGFAAGSDLPALFYAFVTLIGAPGEVRSCGMQNLGLPDACLVEPPTEEAASLLQSFLYYLLAEKPDLRSGQTFSLGPGAPVYRLALEPCRWYPEDDPFFNPYGIWRLTPA